MSDCLTNEEKKCLVEDVKMLLSGGVHKIEIAAEAWDSLLRWSVKDYVLELQQWILENQWSSLWGKDINKTDLCFALTTRTFDAERAMAAAYSKIVGHQSTGNYELKKDYVTIEAGKQVYEIPAGREINEALWVTPSDIRHATVSSVGYGNMLGDGTAWGYGLGFGGGSLGGTSFSWLNGAYYIAPAYDIMLRAHDYGLKNRILKSDLTYKVTALADGRKLLHLYSIPNNGNQIGIRKELYNCKVWYFYYDTLDMDASAKNKCLQSCKDIIKYPSDVPLTQMDYCDLNEPSKIWVQKMFIAYAKETLGRARGKWSGKIAVPDAELTMDYASLLAEAKEEKAELKKSIQEWLVKMGRVEQMQKRADEADALNRLLSHMPQPIFAK